MKINERLNVIDCVERMKYLQGQMRACDAFAPIEFSLGNIGQTIQVYGNESFEKVVEAYEIPKDKIRKSWTTDFFHKDALLGFGYELSVVLGEDEDGYEKENSDD